MGGGASQTLRFPTNAHEEGGKKRGVEEKEGKGGAALSKMRLWRLRKTPVRANRRQYWETEIKRRKGRRDSKYAVKGKRGEVLQD